MVYTSSAATDYFHSNQSCQTGNTYPPIFTNTNTATPTNSIVTKTNLRPAHSWVYISSIATDYFHWHQSCQTGNTCPPIFTNTNTATPTNPIVTKTNLRPAYSWVYKISAATGYLQSHQSCQTGNTWKNSNLGVKRLKNVLLLSCCSSRC